MEERPIEPSVFVKFPTLQRADCQLSIQSEILPEPMAEVIVKALLILSVAYVALSLLDGMHTNWLKACQKEKRDKLAELLGELAIVVVGLFLFVLVGRWAFI